ncbi:uncharacterized protein LOC103788701 [Callithrix jacchus]
MSRGEMRRLCCMVAVEMEECMQTDNSGGKPADGLGGALGTEETAQFWTENNTGKETPQVSKFPKKASDWTQICQVFPLGPIPCGKGSSPGGSQAPVPLVPRGAPTQPTPREKNYRPRRRSRSSQLGGAEAGARPCSLEDFRRPETGRTGALQAGPGLRTQNPRRATAKRVGAHRGAGGKGPDPAGKATPRVGALPSRSRPLAAIRFKGSPARFTPSLEDDGLHGRGNLEGWIQECVGPANRRLRFKLLLALSTETQSSKVLLSLAGPPAWFSCRRGKKDTTKGLPSGSSQFEEGSETSSVLVVTEPWK